MLINKSKVLPLVLLFLLVSSMLCSGCAPREELPETTSETDHVGGTVVVGDSWSVVNLDPALANDQGSIDVITLIFDSLVDHDENYKIIPRLARSWENPDDTTWIFHLQEGAKWHDDNSVFGKGEAPEVTADDVKYTIERILDPATKSTRTTLVASVKEVEAVEKYTVKITTKDPDPFLLDNLASVYIVNKEIVEKLGPEKMARDPIGSGPFVLVENIPDDHVTVVKNEDHWTNPNLDKIIIKPIPDQNAMLIALESGDIDVATQVPQTEVQRLKTIDKLVVGVSPLKTYRWIGLNCETGPTSDVKFRQCIAKAIDMDAAVNAIFPPGTAERAYGPVPPNILGYDPELKKYWEYNPAAAKQMLAELGYTDTDGNGFVEKDGKELKLRLLAPEVDTNRTKLATIVATQLKENVGIKVDVQILEWGTLLSEVDKGNFDMYVLGGFSGPSGMIFLFHSRNIGPNGNSCRYSNPEVDALLDKGATLVDPAEREVVWKQAQEIVVKDVAHIPAYHQSTFHAYTTKLHDYHGDLRFASSKNNAWIEK